jgi:asparagine synthetase B (glutamine-hydrolysing)
LHAMLTVVMDLVVRYLLILIKSIAMAFYFAARGIGYQVNCDGSRSRYITPAKVFFSGLGADEQLG